MATLEEEKWAGQVILWLDSSWLGKWSDLPISDDDNNNSVILLNPASSSSYKILAQFATRYICVPAMSAGVQRIFCESWFLFRPHRARMSRKTLEQLTLLKCILVLADVFRCIVVFFSLLVAMIPYCVWTYLFFFQSHFCLTFVKI